MATLIVPSILITGSNRGIGLELARHYAAGGWRVFATCRRPAEAVALHDLAGHYPELSVHRVDVTISEDIKGIAWELENTPLDVLFNNAGVYLENDYRSPGVGAIRYDDWLRTFEVNTLGAVRMTEALADNVAVSDKRLVTAMTSHMGSIADIETEGSYYYRSSKAALNAAMHGLAVALRSRQIGVLLLHPGAVRTRMGPRDGINPQDAVHGISERVRNFSMADSGAFIKYDGTEMPW